MNKTVYRIMGKRGRVTIPQEFRQQVGFRYNDILSFTRQDDNTVIVKREKVCGSCGGCCPSQVIHDANSSPTLMDFLDGLTPAQQRAALVHLSVKWAERQDGPSGMGMR